MDSLTGISDIGWVDATLLAIVAVSVIVGLVRGLVFEALSLLGWLVAYVAAQWATPQAAPHIPIGVPGSALNHAATFALVFVLALIVWALVARLVRMIVHATPLSLVDRVLGGVFGLLRGAVLLLAVTTVVSLTAAARSDSWRQSHASAWGQHALAGLRPLLPESIAAHLPR